MHGGFFEPRCFNRVTPFGQALRHRHVADELTARFIVGLLQGQRMVINIPARSGEAAHLALLLAVGLEFILKCLAALHNANYIFLNDWQQRGEILLGPQFLVPLRSFYRALKGEIYRALRSANYFNSVMTA